MLLGDIFMLALLFCSPRVGIADCKEGECMSEDQAHLLQSRMRMDADTSGIDDQRDDISQTGVSLEQDATQPSFLQMSDIKDKHGNVVVEKGATVVFSQSDLKVNTITVKAGGTLRFMDKPGLELSAQMIDVYGTLEIGREWKRIEKGLTITLRGKKGSEKGILIQDGGTMAAHGKMFTPTWTRLAVVANPRKAAAKGSRILRVNQPTDGKINWTPGQKLLVVTTVFRDEAHNHQNEIVTIKKVESYRTVAVITIEESLKHNHYSGEEYSGEVALLSRSITIQGDEDSDTDSYGGHTMCMPGATCRLSYIRAHRMGQLNNIGRYPFHFHLMGDTAYKSYFKGLAVEQSYFRAFTVHGTSKVTVSECVAYNVLGNAMYLEDGSEEFNVISHNLIAHVKPIKPFTEFKIGERLGEYETEDGRTQPSDIVASCYYCTNPRNYWIGNVASGGQVGFIFPALPKVVGLSSGKAEYKDLEPMKLEVLQFDDNTAHSAGWWWNTGACMYLGGLLENPDPKDPHFYKYTPGRVNTERGKVVMNRTTFFACRHGLLIWGNKKVNRPHALVVDTTVWDTMTGFRMLGHNHAIGGTVGARSGNREVFEPGENWEVAANPWGELGSRTDTGLVGMTLYDTAAQTMISGVKFKNFNGPHDVVLHAPTKFIDFVPQGQSTLIDLEFEDTDFERRLVLNRGKTCLANCHSSQYGNVMDHDGSLTGLASKFGGGALLGASDNTNPNCRQRCNTKDWWKVDDRCQKRFDSWKKSASGGWWACPTQSSHKWAKSERFVVSVALVSGKGPLAKQPLFPAFTDTHKVLIAPATKHANFQEKLDPIPGKIYHFGYSSRRVQVGFHRRPDAVQVTGVCCDIGWYLVPDGDSPEVLHILLEQIDSTHGLTFAMAYPVSASLSAERCYFFGTVRGYPETCSKLRPAKNKKEFLDSNVDGSKYWVEKRSSAKVLFLKLLNEHGTRFDGGNGNWEVANSFEDQPRYKITDANGGGKVSNALSLLPPANWLKA